MYPRALCRLQFDLNPKPFVFMLGRVGGGLLKSKNKQTKRTKQQKKKTPQNPRGISFFCV